MSEPFIKLLAQLLDDEGTATLGTNLFLTEMPETPDNATMIVTSGTVDQRKDYEIRDIYVDFWIRNTDSAQAYATAQAIWDKLHRRANYQLPGAIYVYFGYATTNIEDFDKDTNQRKVVKLQMRFTYRPLEATS